MFAILFCYLFVQGIEYWLKYINLEHMKKYGMNVPSGFEGFIDEEVLKKTHAYTIESSRLSLYESLFGNVLLIAFIFGGLLNVYNSWVSSLSLPFILHGFIFFILLSYAGSIIEIPFSLYSTFKLENKYGFNTMTMKLWIKDFLKSILISTVLMGIIISGSMWLIQTSPYYWWLFAWGFFLIFSLFIMYISPYVIEPLFNKFTPLEGDELEDKIRDMMNKAGIKVSRVFKMDASKRSKHTNAYFTGIGKVKRIVLFDTLIQKMDMKEILAVLAHEVGHWKKKHVLKMIVRMELMSFAAAYIAFRILNTDILSNIFNAPDATFFSKLVILGFLFSMVSFPFTPLFSYLSRRHENEADRFAVELTSDNESLATSLIKLSKDNLSNLHPHPTYAKFYYSHPPVVERVKRIRSLGA
ncbi:MAG: peptidase M48 [Nitrospirae bacterium GWC2_42_7]|nr:MAG: peptidase M48 [Nitrospirae bacterium GWC2_42_7]